MDASNSRSGVKRDKAVGSTMMSSDSRMEGAALCTAACPAECVERWAGLGESSERFRTGDIKFAS